MDAVLKAFEGQRKDLRAQLDDIDRKEAAVRQALDKRPIDRRASVPDDTYDSVLSYLRKNPNSRQADMARDLKLNSGIISQAMKVAVDRHEAEVDKEGRGARYTVVRDGRKSK